MPGVLDITAALPEVGVAGGEVLFAEDQPNQALWVLLSGTLAVSKRGQQVAAVSQPGR